MKNNKDKVRIIIGNAIHGKSGLSKPTKTLIIEETTVQEVYEKLIEVLQNESK